MTSKKNKLLQSKFQFDLIKEISDGYSSFLEELFEEFSETYVTKFLSKEFISTINKVISDDALYSYSPLRFYFSKQLEDLLFLSHLHFELKNDQTVEDEIFDFWKDSDYSETFLEMNQSESGEQIANTSEGLVPLLENQILCFYFIHISTSPETQPGTLSYCMQTNIGDSASDIFISDSGYRVSKENLFNEGIIPIHLVTNQRISLEVDSNDEVSSYPIDQSVESIDLGNSQITINISSDLKDKSQEIKTNIQKALKNIEKASPSLFDCFLNFSKVIVPMTEEGIVSYSTQSLPGYSSINIQERSFLELHDDLLHENGHHYMNALLNTKDLILEDDEQIFYSPWRKARRPIRGIYHAFFTFYWAFQLFHDLSLFLENNKLDGILDSDIEVIKRRCVEEFLMLNYSFNDLNIAHEMGKVTPEGLEVMTLVKDILDESMAYVERLKSELKSPELKVISALEVTLKEENAKSNY
ncbi:MAG: hypothetical protein KC493_02840 [Bacteriovoracaceae bacterium]|nr:hypothetical protein [Bacteriovoracaceae bacterium]